MRIFVNGRELTLDAPQTVRALLERLGATGALVALPVAGGVLAAGALGFVSYRYMFRHALKKAIEELDGLLVAIDRDLRSLAVFGDRSA